MQQVWTPDLLLLTTQCLINLVFIPHTFHSSFWKLGVHWSLLWSTWHCLGIGQQEATG